MAYDVKVVVPGKWRTIEVQCCLLNSVVCHYRECHSLIVNLFKCSFSCSCAAIKHWRSITQRTGLIPLAVFVL